LYSRAHEFETQFWGKPVSKAPLVYVRTLLKRILEIIYGVLGCIQLVE
jgi:hypothetical protein